MIIKNGNRMIKQFFFQFFFLIFIFYKTNYVPIIELNGGEPEGRDREVLGYVPMSTYFGML